MANVNPYQAPAAAVGDAGSETQPVRIFSIAGRIGRARYLAYGFGFYVLFGFAGVMLAGLLGPDVGMVVLALAYIALVVLGVMLTIQRCHDFNVTGWLSLLIVVPIANLIFLFIPGTDGANRFGAPTPPNSIGVLIAAWLIPAVFVLGVIAAIAIPSYSDYVKRAKQGEVQQR